MQTFLSETSFSASAEVLDKQRLQKQLLEGRQILSILVKPILSGAWTRHPAVLMWKGHEFYLYLYLKRIKEECEYRNVQIEKNWTVIQELFPKIPKENHSMPEWWEDEVLKERVVVTHRARLYVKNPVHYAGYERFFEPAENMRCCSHCNYFWPSHHEKNGGQFLITNKKRSK